MEGIEWTRAVMWWKELTLFPSSEFLFCRLDATFRMLDLDYEGHSLDMIAKKINLTQDSIVMSLSGSFSQKCLRHSSSPDGPIAHLGS